jgi:ABC-type transport system involved in multi-copper enzyme maturation permease subunit
MSALQSGPTVPAGHDQLAGGNGHVASSVEAATAATVELTKPASERRDAWADGWLKIETLLDRVGDRLNPILVKEARQAMKSRQFVVTFSLLLIFGWLWTVLFIAFGVPAIFYAPVGPGVLTGYYVVLSIPLLIVVPYAAFRSLAAEREDGTYELLSITSLTARQIVLGKLGSAILQMMVYYSALAPCIAFTYLMRGIDVVTIALFLAYTFLASLLLSIFGLMMATVTRSRHWQVLLSVVFVMALLVAGFFWDMGVLTIIVNANSLPYDNAEFWIVNLCVLSFYVPLALLFLLIAAGQITFASENRSTPIRAVLLVPQLLLVGWFVYFWLRFKAEEPMYVFACLAGIYAALCGMFLTGETAQLSPRAMRQLPQSLLGRMTFTWFNPGSGTGYMFAVLNLLATLIVAAVAIMVGHIYQADDTPLLNEWFPVVICVFGYVAGYLGLTRLLITLARRITPVGMLATFLCHVILATGGVLFPLLLQALISWGNFTSFEYTSLQLPNWCWTLYETIDNAGAGLTNYAFAIIGLFGLVMLALNVLLTAREVEHVRLQAPRRVQEDEAALHPQPVKVVKKSPWD